MSPQATEVRKLLDRMGEQNFERHTGGVTETTEELMRRVVEDGEMYPDAKMHADLSLTLRERLTGRRRQDVTAVFLMGLTLGCALERDIPMDSVLEDQWRDGQFELPGAEVT